MKINFEKNGYVIIKNAYEKILKKKLVNYKSLDRFKQKKIYYEN